MFKKALFASAAVMAAGVASAEVTGNFAVTSDYIFRGVSSGQAVQGGLDYSHDSGLYAGTWLSNAGAGTDEVDYYVGYGLGLSEGLSLDLGYIRYTTDTSAAADIDEVYVGLAGEAWGATLYYGALKGEADGNFDNYLYLDLGYDLATGETTSVSFHAGMTSVEDDAARAAPLTPYSDSYDVSVALNVGDFSIGASYLDSDKDIATNEEELIGVVSWGTSFDVK